MNLAGRKQNLQKSSHMAQGLYLPPDSPLVKFVEERAAEFGGKTSPYLRHLVQRDYEGKGSLPGPKSTDALAKLAELFAPGASAAIARLNDDPAFDGSDFIAQWLFGLAYVAKQHADSTPMIISAEARGDRPQVSVAFTPRGAISGVKLIPYDHTAPERAVAEDARAAYEDLKRRADENLAREGKPQPRPPKQ